MPQNASIYGAFLRQVRASPHADAIVFPEMTFSFEQMNRLAMAFASQMNAAGVGANSTLTLQSSEPSVVLATLLAASYLGAAIVQDNDGLILPKSLSVTHHFHTVEAGRTPAEGSRLIDSTWSPAANSGNFPDAAEQDCEKPWLYVYTSGTTGAPKFIALSQRMVCDRSMAVADDFLTGQTRFASLAPSNTRPFMARGLAALLNGATIVGGKYSRFLAPGRCNHGERLGQANGGIFWGNRIEPAPAARGGDRIKIAEIRCTTLVAEL